MKILFDQGVPVPLRGALGAHEILTAYERGWAKMKNGDLLSAAEAEEFAAIVTTDQNLHYQQNLTNRRIAILVLMTTDWRAIRARIDLVAAAIDALQTGDYRELHFPH